MREEQEKKELLSISITSNKLWPRWAGGELARFQLGLPHPETWSICGSLWWNPFVLRSTKANGLGKWATSRVVPSIQSYVDSCRASESCSEVLRDLILCASLEVGMSACNCPLGKFQDLTNATHILVKQYPTINLKVEM